MKVSLTLLLTLVGLIVVSQAQSLLLEDEEVKPQTNLVSNIPPDVFDKLKLPIKSIAIYQVGNTNKVAVQIFVIKDKPTGSREFYFDANSAIQAVKAHNNNYRMGFILENGAVELVGGKPLILENKSVKCFVLRDTTKNTITSYNSFEQTINEFNSRNAAYHGLDRSYPVILEKIVYEGEVEQKSDL